MLFIKRALSALLVLLSLLVWQPANATILFGGGEDLDFTLIGASGADTTSGHFRSAYARLAISTNDSASVSDPVVARIYTAVFTGTQDLWLHTQYFTSQAVSDVSAQTACAITADGVCRLLIRGVGTTGTVKVSTRTAGGALVDLVTCTVGGFPVQNVLGAFDWHINYAVSGSVDLYFRDTSVCHYSGDVTAASGQTLVNQFYLGGTSTSGGAPNDWSEVIVSSTDSRDMNLFTCAPQAAGTTQTWTGVVGSVNPLGYSDVTSISTASTGNISNWTCPVLPAGTFTVPAVIQSARVQSVTGITNFRFNSRPAGAGADFDTSADIPAIGTFQNYQNNIVSTNPATAGAWTPSSLGAGVNFGIKSRP